MHRLNLLSGCYRSFLVQPCARTLSVFSWLAHKPGCAHLAVMCILLIWFWPATADEVRLTVAANFTAPIQKTAPDFEQATGHRLLLGFGSTGKFYAQIQNGVPFALLLSADQTTLSKLIDDATLRRCRSLPMRSILG